MRVSLVAAAGLDDGIGRGGRMPWHLPADLRHFKQLTLGRPVIMGRKTLQSIGRPLPGRRNLVVTRDTTFSVMGFEICHSLDEALELTSEVAETMVIGGGEIYRAAWNWASRIYLTRVHMQTRADTFFPTVDLAEWRETAREDHRADPDNPHDYSFIVYERL